MDEHPDIVAQKTRPGDWEIDTVRPEPSRRMSNASGSGVPSRFILIKKVDSKQAEVVTAATIILLQPYLDKTLTITADNGKEFAGHEKIKEHLNADVSTLRPIIPGNAA